MRQQHGYPSNPSADCKLTIVASMQGNARVRCLANRERLCTAATLLLNDIN